MRLALILAFLLAIAAAPGSPALARTSAHCAQLADKLAAVSELGGNAQADARYRRYAEAVRRQENALRQLEQDRRASGCGTGSLLIVGGPQAATCRRLEATDRKMQANLRALERKRDSYDRANSAIVRRRIETAMLASDCGLPGASEPPREVTASISGEVENRPRIDAEPRTQPGTNSNIIDMQNGARFLDDSGGQMASTRGSDSTLRLRIERRSPYGGNLRTLCVRTCDGYYFPISSAATSMDFARDARACQMMCPGTPTELYFHSVRGQDSEDMVSVATHRPYTDLPAAFRYRDTKAAPVAGCSCNMKAFHNEMQRREALITGQDRSETASRVPVPASRPDPGEDPETIANGQAGFDSRTIAAITAASQTDRPAPGKPRPVRIVGPAFLPESSERLDFTANTETVEDLFR
ncbi:DUF2865 domain-containing protein [Pseudohoeflea coraliihabitans]|uniref:DUF2865 domain-containing protein n=1 Tax=Pseudohoeflea coraliihabitans TaxID=2860393 RepID=A0ABS6WQ54_9HYPH|nr:DUF2865 domain-containing protein [Pseudohoeflea sp. DP4N28-3]MBW3098050.1 DUF2865 domain-containing protein [Pseudohoeflea sp. DP4N28-3]